MSNTVVSAVVAVSVEAAVAVSGYGAVNTPILILSTS
jgi:hypothetical protein